MNQNGAIIGGGIGGLSLALALKKKGILLPVYEEAADFRPVGAGIMLAQNAMQIFQELGVAGAIIKSGHQAESFALTDEKLRIIQSTNQKHLENKLGFRITMIRRSRLHEILLDCLDKSQVFRGKSFSHFIQNAEAVRIYFNDSTASDLEYLIGADGLHSRIRKQIFPDMNYRKSGQICWRGISKNILPDEIKNKALEIWGNQIRFGIAPVSDEEVYWFAVSEKENKFDINNFPEREAVNFKSHLLNTFRNFADPVGDLIENTDESSIIFNELNDLEPFCGWNRHRVCLIGDAAHAMTPNMGQGGCQAVEDASVLAELISKNNPIDAFDTFSRVRCKRVSSIVKQSFSAGKIAHIKNGQKIRNLLLRMIPSFLMERRMISLLKVKHRW